jgi:predicted RNA-binding protein with PIN domain
MPFLIDGHNLIGKIPGLKLDDLDDEQDLIKLLQEYCLLTGKDAEVYFDTSSTGHARARVHGRVIARFVRSGETADQAIVRHLKRLGKQASNWTVISSDAAVQRSAKRVRARVLSSEAFAHDLLAESTSPSTSDKPQINDKDVDEWLEMFGSEE